MFKNFKYLFDPKAGPIRFDLLYFLSVYILFFSASVTSDIIFILGFTGFIETTIVGYSFLLWLAAYIIFILSVQISISVERHELTLMNFIIIVFMYFSYCKLWTIVALIGLFSFIRDMLFKRETKWYKTERF
ncbi:hypothetical protein SDC9_163443 [bioreactor metagenome]|uniref:Uncharacterized protein n=1 Tax=bioreactor metagenome TaxID=1076179 RepID=A0A645FNV5_9ZZZZ